MKQKVLKVRVEGTGINQEFFAIAHEIVAYPASTYHKFTYSDGTVVYKNDFGVSQVTILPVDLPSRKNS